MSILDYNVVFMYPLTDKVKLQYPSMFSSILLSINFRIITNELVTCKTIKQNYRIKTSNKYQFKMYHEITAQTNIEFHCNQEIIIRSN